MTLRADNSVNCYFCGTLVSDSDSTNADDLTDDGGSACAGCRILANIAKTVSNVPTSTGALAEGVISNE